MCLKNKSQFFHGITFHHFHDDKIYRRSQGSISKDEFYKLINFIGRKNILNANIFFDKFQQNKLKENEICLTFDDGIKDQIDIALPILEDLKIKSFFFVYTSMFEGKPDNLEVFRYFRNNIFNSIEEFYINFYKVLNKDLYDFFNFNKEIISKTKIIFPFYNIEDIKFRLVRDKYLKKEEYEKNMFEMMREKNFEYQKYFSNIFFDKNDLVSLHSLGHIIGLHSHNHPTLLENLSYDEQKSEYINSISIFSNILNISKNEIKTMSHPNGSYNNYTLKILNELGIELGFKQIMQIEPEKGMKKINNSKLEIAREDCAIILNKIRIN